MCEAKQDSALTGHIAVRNSIYLPFSGAFGVRNSRAHLSRFDLVMQPVTVTFDAACSNHRKRDAMSLHRELVAPPPQLSPTNLYFL